ITQRILPALVIIIMLATPGCRKDSKPLNKQNSGNNHIALYDPSQNRIKINQAISVYDSTLERDSVNVVYSPTDKYYQWQVIPNNGCDSIMGDQHKGFASF